MRSLCIAAKTIFTRHALHHLDEKGAVSRSEVYKQFQTANEIIVAWMQGCCMAWNFTGILSFNCYRCNVKQSFRLRGGSICPPKLAINYLGSVLCHDGLPGHELGRRIGMPKQDLLELKVWKHSSLSRKGSNQ